MSSVILVIHMFLALAIIGLVLLQRSEGGGLGIGGGGGGLGGVATPQGTANILSRATAICAAAFFCTSLILGVLAGQQSQQKSGLLEALENAPAAAVAPLEAASDALDSARDMIVDDKDDAVEKIPEAPIAE